MKFTLHDSIILALPFICSPSSSIVSARSSAASIQLFSCVKSCGGSKRVLIACSQVWTACTFLIFDMLFQLLEMIYMGQIFCFQGADAVAVAVAVISSVLRRRRVGAAAAAAFFVNPHFACPSGARRTSRPWIDSIRCCSGI